MADLRGFTVMSKPASLTQVIETLNAWFDSNRGRRRGASAERS